MIDLLGNSAVFSPDRMFRYRLDRYIGAGEIVAAVFGVNPSTAGEEKNDQTANKWRGFGERLGWRRYIAANPFALVSTDVRGLASAPDPFGPDNARHIAEIVAEADILVPCWGRRSKLPNSLRPHLDVLRAVLLGSGKPVMCWGLTACGEPVHPMMLGYSTPLVPLPAARDAEEER